LFCVLKKDQSITSHWHTGHINCAACRKKSLTATDVYGCYKVQSISYSIYVY